MTSPSLVSTLADQLQEQDIVSKKKPIAAVHEVLNYDVLLEDILSNLTDLELKNCQDVSLLFQSVSKQVDAKRRRITNLVRPFRILRFEDERKNLFASQALSQISEIGTDGIEKHFIAHIDKSFAKPSVIILIEGNNTKVGKRRRWKRAKIINAIRSKLPPSCRIIGIDAHYGLIGNAKHNEPNYTKKDPLAFSFDILNLFSASCCFIPTFEGVEIKVFNRISELIPKPNIKALVLFSSGLTHSGEYLELTNVAQLFTEIGGQVAIAGAQINDRLTTTLVDTHYSDDTANFFFVNGRPPYNPMYNPQKLSLIGLMFSGENVKAASLVIEPLLGSHYKKDQDQDNENGNCHNSSVPLDEELKDIERQIVEFKSKLDFDVDDDVSAKSETLAFVFFNYRKFRTYCQDAQSHIVNPGLDAIKRNFRRAQLIGLLTHAQYEHNYWPGAKVNIELAPRMPSSSSIASLLLLNVRKL